MTGDAGVGLLSFSFLAGVAVALLWMATVPGVSAIACTQRPGYVYVVDSHACVPMGALVPAKEVK